MERSSILTKTALFFRISSASSEVTALDGRTEIFPCRSERVSLAALMGSKMQYWLKISPHRQHSFRTEVLGMLGMLGLIPAVLYSGAVVSQAWASSSCVRHTTRSHAG